MIYQQVYFVYAEKNNAVLIWCLVFYCQAFVSYLKPNYTEFTYPVILY